MMREEKPLYKIYSRNRVNLIKQKKYGRIHKKKDIKKLFFTLLVIIIALIYIIIYKSITPIFETICIDEANAIATRITNEGTTKIMKNHTYNEMFTIDKDNEGNIQMIKSNVFIINEIESDITSYIQDKIDNNSSSNVKLAIGSFTGIKILSGVGPKIKIKLNSAGRLNTNLKSEFVSQGINQTIHRIYFHIDCNVDILTPFNTITQNISNQVLLAENVILGKVPETFYNLEGMSTMDTLNVTQ